MSTLSEQVKELRTIANNLSIGHNMPISLAIEHFRKAADTIESLSAKLQAANMENVGGWIADREPEESGYYLVTYHEWSNGNFLPKFDDTYVKRLHYQKSEQFIGRNFPKCVDKRAEENMNVEVLAWQPLPEPYRP